jgi:hypothetical protein
LRQRVSIFRGVSILPADAYDDDAFKVLGSRRIDGCARKMRCMDESQIKEAFFRKFSRLEDDDKKRIQDMIDAWGKKK